MRIAKSYFFKLKPFHFRQYLGNNQILIRTKQDFCLFILGNDATISPWLLLKGVYEPHLTSFLNRKTKPGMTVVDIGANMGYYSALFASKGACVHAFEPNPQLQEVLRKNIYLNAGSLTPQCAVNQCAVGALEDTLSMKFPRWLTGGGSILNEERHQDFLDLGHNESVKINIITLDKYVKLNNLKRIDIIKVDVEGYEEEVLKGATELIRRSKNLILCIEYTRNSYSSDFPSWLFKMFTKAYLPKFKRSINLKFLKLYDSGDIFSSIDLLDIVFIKGHRSI